MKNGVNLANCENQNIKIKYVYLTGPQVFSLETEFMNKGTKIHWKPKMPKFNNETDTYSMLLHGEYNRCVIRSNKNTVLVNDNDQLCFICRRVGNDEFEIECHPKVSQAVIFAIALCQLIGPDPTYTDIIKM